MNFGEALTLIKNGIKMSRAGWNGKGMWIEIQRPDANSKMTLPYLFLNYPHGDKVPWLASQTDILQEDWMVYVEEEKPKTFTLNIGQVDAMKRAGVWGSPIKRKAAIRQYAQASVIVETPKKPHWTQTAKGKKIMAARKRKGK